MKINVKYISAFLILFMTETIIALFIRDAIIRPYVGDILIVILMYTFIRGIIKKPIKFLPLYLFLFSLAVEISQYFHLINILHLQNNKVFSIILGTSFSMVDILCYLIGSVILVIWERIERNSGQ